MVLRCFVTQDFGNELFGPTYPMWESQSIVTPGISGLLNGPALQAMWDAGVRNVVGDSSKWEYRPVNLYHGLWTTQAFNGFDGMFIVPRCVFVLFVELW